MRWSFDGESDFEQELTDRIMGDSERLEPYVIEVSFRLDEHIRTESGRELTNHEKKGVTAWLHYVDWTDLTLTFVLLDEEAQPIGEHIHIDYDMVDEIHVC